MERESNVPQYAIVTDQNAIAEVISENPFATIVYQEQGRLESFHLPLLFSEGKLIGHLAKANGAWRSLEQYPALFIFHGPHCYISPTWYGAGEDVPTWNYISVQVIIHHDEKFLREALEILSKKYDPEFPITENINHHSDLLAGIVGIEVSVDETFAKFKIGQRKSISERENVIKHLKQLLEPSAQLAMADAISRTLSVKAP